MISTSRRPLVSEQNFVLATRDTGYRSTATAVAELIDNSIEARAKTIHIRVTNHGVERASLLSMTILDDGIGMGPDELWTALQFGGTERFNSRSGLGRFGMGLPNSSVSQCRRVEVYSWRDSARCYYTYLDIDEILAEELREIPKPIIKKIPTWIQDEVGDSGTLIVWSRCDRLDNRRASTVAKKLHDPLGRIFRYAIHQGVRILINGTRVVPVDPLYISEDSILSGASRYLSPIIYDIKVPGDDRDTAQVKVLFSRLPTSKWHAWPAEQKRRLGISGGAGVSIVRAGREIAYGWYFLKGKRKQNYDDWWRAEISFDPRLDEWFGVTHSKQGISPTPELMDILSPDMVSVANTLNAQIREEFSEIKAQRERSSVKTANRNDWRLPPLPKTMMPDIELNERISRWEADLGIQYQITQMVQSSPEFFLWAFNGQDLSLIINKEHAFFKNAYQPLVESDARFAIHTIECTLLAFARSEARRTNPSEQALLTQFRKEWSDALVAFLA